MAPYHAMATHFPVALWITAFLVIVIRTFSNGSFAKTIDAALSPLLLLGVLAGTVTYGIGLLVWPWDALLTSPLGRNHLLMGTWTLAYWTLVWVTRWRSGTRVWQGTQRWLMLALAALGAGLLAITGTLGADLAGNPSALPELLRRFGWDVNTTFYLPSAMLLVVVATAVVMVLLGAMGRQRP